MRSRIRRLAWSAITILGGVCSIVLALLVEAGAISPLFTGAAIWGAPLLVMLAAFIGMMTSESFIMAPLSGAVAIVAPIVDMTWRSYQAGNFDDARLMGLGTGVCLAIVGAIAFVAELRKRSVHPARGAAASAL
ncbi:hypothetical protein [Microbacterium sp. KR10-403]|uniref:hypothetical protein n=1 Tax=Microbacterium sp. KR10-403 TaxID=3158581 RepID=UPI0032E48915